MRINEWKYLLRHQESIPETLCISSAWGCSASVCTPWEDTYPLRCLLTVGCGSYCPMRSKSHLWLVVLQKPRSEIVTLLQLFEEKFAEHVLSSRDISHFYHLYKHISAILTNITLPRHFWWNCFPTLIPFFFFKKKLDPLGSQQGRGPHEPLHHAWW